VKQGLLEATRGRSRGFLRLAFKRRLRRLGGLGEVVSAVAVGFGIHFARRTMPHDQSDALIGSPAARPPVEQARPLGWAYAAFGLVALLSVLLLSSAGLNHVILESSNRHVEALNRTNAYLEVRLHSLAEEHETFKQKLDARSDSVSEERRRASLMHEGNVLLLEKKERENKALADENRHAKEKIAALEKHKKNLVRDLNNLHEKFGEENVHLLEEKERENKALADENKHSKEKIAALQKHKENLVRDLNNLQEKYREEKYGEENVRLLEQKERENKALSEENKHAEEKIAALQKHKKNLVRDLNNLLEKYNDMKEKRSDLAEVLQGVVEDYTRLYQISLVSVPNKICSDNYVSHLDSHLLRMCEELEKEAPRQLKRLRQHGLLAGSSYENMFQKSSDSGPGRRFFSRSDKPKDSFPSDGALVEHKRDGFKAAAGGAVLCSILWDLTAFLGNPLAVPGLADNLICGGVYAAGAGIQHLLS